MEDLVKVNLHPASVRKYHHNCYCMFTSTLIYYDYKRSTLTVSVIVVVHTPLHNPQCPYQVGNTLQLAAYKIGITHGLLPYIINKRENGFKSHCSWKPGKTVVSV